MATKLTCDYQGCSSDVVSSYNGDCFLQRSDFFKLPKDVEYTTFVVDLCEVHADVMFKRINEFFANVNSRRVRKVTTSTDIFSQVFGPR